MTLPRSIRWPLRVVAALALLGLFGAGAFVAAPLPEGLLAYRPVTSVRILDRRGGVLRELLSRADGRSTPVSASELPPQVRAAFVAAEDSGFWRHLGISPSAIGRAAWQNVKAGRVVAGGSTLTQQLARNLVPRPRSLGGKLQEALWAFRLEAHLGKEEILAQYLNRISFGNGTFGIEAASELYFGRRTRHLSVAQAAALAAIPRGPTAYDPYRNGARLQKRKKWVLERMEKLGLVPAEELAGAGSETLDLQIRDRAFRAPHLVEYVAAHLEAWGLGNAVEVHTTLDPELQREVEDIVQQEISRLGDRRVGSSAVVVADNQSGEILAYLGSADFFDAEHQGQNDGVQMTRQPGSALKPFLYAEAFRAGFTPATVIPDLEAHLPGAKGLYAPKNYDRRLHGPVRVREALASSYNVPAVRIADQLGTERVLRTLRRAGFTSLDQGAGFYGVGMVLGNGEVSLLEAATAYSGLARGGVLRPLQVLRRALDAQGQPLPLPAREKDRRFADRTAVALLTDILSDPSARARAFGLDNALRLPFPSAAKTGTSKGYSDNWTVGYTRERTVAVWAGNFDGTPMVEVSGITGAGPVYRRTLARAMSGITGAPLYDPRLVERVEICPISGALPGPSCPSHMSEVFAPGTAPREPCAMHRPLTADLPRALAAQCRKLAPGGAVLDLGHEYYEWARAEGLAAQPWLAAMCSSAPASTGDTTRILYPPQGTEFLLFPDLPLADQTIPLRIQAAPSEGRLVVRLNGTQVDELEAPYTSRLRATLGENTITLHRKRDSAQVASTSFRVREEPR